MIINDNRQFIFIHNPKCAGTSFRSALDSYDTTGRLFARIDSWNGHPVETTHLPLFMMQVQYPEYFRKFDSYFSFMAVRNPFARFVSGFNEVNQEIYADYIKSGDVSRYRHEVNRFALEMPADAIRGWDFNYRHFVRQVDFAYVGRKNYVDAIIRIEEQDKGLDKLAVFDAEIAHVLRKAQPLRARPVKMPLAELLDPGTVKKLIELYERDFVLFGYERFVPEATVTE